MDKLTKEQFFAHLDSLTILEIADYVKEFETRYGISAAAAAPAPIRSTLFTTTSGKRPSFLRTLSGSGSSMVWAQAPAQVEGELQQVDDGGHRGGERQPEYGWDDDEQELGCIRFQAMPPDYRTAIAGSYRLCVQ